jgi:uncharacterized protein YabN with tetrapyrrole methylase and pyrophosphatase domain
LTSGSLTVVGTGIGLGFHLTPEARAACEHADDLLYLAAETVVSSWLAGLNPRSRSLQPLYREDASRAEIYDSMAEEIVLPVRRGRTVCAAFYGHPGVFGYPAHEAIRRAREEGFRARMLPAISAEDCLFADLGVDPAAAGCQSYDATDFLVSRRRPDITAALLLWQISVIGAHGWSPEPSYDNLPVLVEYLLELYPADHEVTVYEASPYPVGAPHVERVRLDALSADVITPMATLYVPPAKKPEVDGRLSSASG